MFKILQKENSLQVVYFCVNVINITTNGPKIDFKFKKSGIHASMHCFTFLGGVMAPMDSPHWIHPYYMIALNLDYKHEGGQDNFRLQPFSNLFI